MARLTPILPTLAALVLTALAGSGASCSTSGRVTLPEFLAENAKLVCEGIFDCGGLLDEAACESGLAGEGSAQSRADVASGRVTFDGAAAAQCLEYRRRHAGDCDIGSLRADPAGAACSKVFTGARGVGEACFSSRVCAEGSCAVPPCPCDPTTGECPCCVGTCVASPGLGEDCTGKPCASGLVCLAVPGAQTPLCEPLFEPGELCSGPFTCVDSVECVQPASGEPSVCGVAPAEGERCLPGATFACARSDDWCDPVDAICKRRLALDVPCTPNGGDGPCVNYAICNGGRCSLPPGEGEPCAKVPGLLISCAGGLRCSNDVCAVDSTPPHLRPTVCD